MKNLRFASMLAALTLAPLTTTGRARAASPVAAPARTAATPAGDADAATSGEARAHYQRGVAFYKDGDFKTSLVEFRRAYELSSNYRVLYNIGRVHQQLNEYAKALASLEHYLRVGGASIPDDRRAQVLADVAELRKRTVHLAVGVDAAEAEIFVDGSPVGRSPLAEPLLLDAGEHHVEVQRRGYEGARASMTLGAGETRRVDLHLEEIKARVVEAPRVLATPTPAPAHRSSAPAWIAWSSAGALAVGAGVTGWMASREAQKLETQMGSPGSTADERHATKQDASRLATVSDVLTATAVATGVVALYLTLRPLPSGAPTKDAKVALGLCGAGACASGRF